MKAINFINWKYIGLTGCLVASLLTACGDDETGPEVVMPLEPKLEIVNEASTFSFSSAGNSAQVLTFNANQDWHIVLDDSEGVDNSWVVLFEREGTAGEGNKVWVAAAENVEPDARRANFSLVSGGFKFDFVIYQAQKDAVVITDPKAYENLDAGEHIISVEFGINTGEYKTSFLYSGDTGWIMPTDERPAGEPETRAMENHTLYFKVLPNQKFDIRRGTIEISSKDNDNVKATMNIFQTGLPKPVITVDNKEMFTNLASKEDSILLKYKATNTNGPRDLTIDIDKNDQDWISFKPAIDAKGDSTFLVSVKENTGGERTATIALCAAADKKVREEFIVTQAQASDVELVITNKNDFRTSLDKLGSAATVKYSVQSTLTDPKNEILVDIVYPEESGYTAENGWLHMANNSMPERVIFTYDVNKVLRERQATVYIYRKGYENKKDYMVIRQAAATQIEIPAPGGLTNVLQGLIDDEIYKDWESITSLELKGRLNDTDLNLLKNMMTAGKGYNLKTLDMTEVENETLKNGVFNGCNLLENISFPTGLQYVPREACRNCTKLRTVVVNEGPTYIGRHAFGNSVVNEAWFPSTMTYVYGYIFDNVTALKTLHLKSLPFQCKEVARSDADEGATQPTTWCTVFKTWPSTVYVPMEYLEYYKNPDPKYVVSMHFQDLLNTLTSESEEWTKGPKVQQPYLKSNSALKSNFTWGSSATTIMGESN